MNLSEKLSAAFDFYEAKNFDAALTLIDELKKTAPHLKRVVVLEAWIYFKREEYLRAFDVLTKLLPQFDLTVPYEKFLAAQTAKRLGNICNEFSRPFDMMEFYLLEADLHDENPEACAAVSNAIFIANTLENFSKADFDKLYARYKSHLSDVVPFEPKIYCHKKIRVGFLSNDFYSHSTIRWGGNLVTEIDKNFFEVFCYSSNKEHDEITDFFRKTVDGWRDISALTDEAAAKLIRDDEIDILFDLSGHTPGSRLRVAAYRPASVQISGIGYMNSTGLDCFDYFLSDVHCAGDKSWFTEKLIRLPQTHCTYLSRGELKILDKPPCLRKGFVTFGCFNNFIKVTDTMLAAWKKILDRVPNSRLILKNKTFSSTDGRNSVVERLKNCGFDLSRVDMRLYSDDYLEQYNDMDIALDTFPYTGGITTCEAFWMGVPVVSLYGDRHGTRFGLSMLTNVGLEELAVDNVDDYISRAVMLANDWELLTLLRRNLRGMLKNSPLMDGKTYARNVEKVFAKILAEAQERHLNDF